MCTEKVGISIDSCRVPGVRTPYPVCVSYASSSRGGRFLEGPFLPRGDADSGEERKTQRLKTARDSEADNE